MYKLCELVKICWDRPHAALSHVVSCSPEQVQTSLITCCYKSTYRFVFFCMLVCYIIRLVYFSHIALAHLCMLVCYIIRINEIYCYSDLSSSNTHEHCIAGNCCGKIFRDFRELACNHEESFRENFLLIWPRVEFTVTHV